eukprot:1499228-Rhodomonas_salina.2
MELVGCWPDSSTVECVLRVVPSLRHPVLIRPSPCDTPPLSAPHTCDTPPLSSSHMRAPDDGSPRGEGRGQLEEGAAQDRSDVTQVCPQQWRTCLQ